MSTQFDFSTIENRYTFEINLQLITPLHIGGNQEEAITSDNPVIRDTTGKPFIPGSSLKGLFRTASERTVHLLTAHKDTCFLENGGCQPLKNEELNQLAKQGEEQQLFKAIYQELCPVCQTYGGGSIASKVKFQHILFTESPLTRVRTSNRISRETGAVADGALFSYEYIQPEQPFKIVIEAENMTKLNLQTLALALAQLQQNTIRFGGKQAKGLGQVEFIDGTVKIEDFDSTNKKQALSLLLGLEQGKTQDLSTFLNDLLLAEVN